jgi:tRNA-2-methylthio-N6-dimethylallyladenosine synthase
MNRGYNADGYRRIVECLRFTRGDIAFSSDFIVGFPGESDADFQATLDLVEEIGFAQAFSFKYSPRPGTPAASHSEQVPEAAKSGRLAILQQLLAGQQLAFNRSCIGQTLPVLLEKRGRHDGQVVGRSPYLQSVHLTAAKRRIGEIVPVRISAASANSLAGSLDGSEVE